MAPKSTLIVHNGEIELREIILIVWKEKFSILIVTLIFAVVGYFYGINKPKVYQTAVTFTTELDYSFDSNNEFFDKKLNINLIDKKLNINLLSTNNLTAFLDQTDKFKDLKSYLKENGTNPESYFKDKLNLVKKDEYLNDLSLTYSKPFNAEEFLNEYVLFVKNKTEMALKKTIINKIFSRIETYKENFEIAKKIDLEDPVFSTIDVFSKDYSNLFYRGTKVLSQQIIDLEDRKNKIIDAKLFSLIVIKTMNSYVISKTANFYILISIFLGLFFSTLIILLRKFVLNT